MKLKVKLIYYVDDDADDHFFFDTIMTEYFKETTYRPFYDCGQVVEFLNDESQELPDMIFLDLNMPGNFNYDCLKAIKTTARTMQIPVIIYSTADDGNVTSSSIKSGAFRHVVKPTTIAQLKKILTELFYE